MTSNLNSNKEDELDWEPIDGPGVTELSEFQRQVSLKLDQLEREAAVAESKTRVNENMEDVLQAVDELLKAEEDSVGSGEDTITPPKEAAPKKRRESRLKLRRRLKAAREKLKESVKPVARASVNATRRIVTGSKQTRVRDFVVLPKVIRVLDKYTFTGGVMGMLLTEFILLQFPQWFRYYNALIMLPLLGLRVVLFHRTKQQYFLLDYCYWVNSLGMILAALPYLRNFVPNFWDPASTERILWQIFFVSSNGPLFFAMVAWNNSLVFHSVDKVTSTYVHLFPALLSWCERWSAATSAIYYGEQTAALSWSNHLGYPLLFYTLWQTVYLVQTEWWHRHVLDADPDLSTSLRYLSSAHKMGINKRALQICRTVGIMSPTETFDPPTLKVKIIFVVFQMIMTICTFLPVRLLYQSKVLHTVVVLCILTFSVYNGARYYIQVFSKIYDKRYHEHGRAEEEYVDTSAVMSEHKKSS